VIEEISRLKKSVHALASSDLKRPAQAPEKQLAKRGVSFSQNDDKEKRYVCLVFPSLESKYLLELNFGMIFFRWISVECSPGRNQAKVASREQ
jgi:hypothetical protein